jgi:uncharacterized membrane protein
MNWLLRYRFRMFLRSSLWAPAVASVAVALVAAPLIRMIDDDTRWTLMGFGLDGAKALAGALSSSLLTLIVFSFSIILLAVQVAGSQLSPRVIARIYVTRRLKLVVGAFVFSYTYTLAYLGRIEGRVPQLPMLVAVLSSLFSVVLFLYLIQMAGQDLRQGAVLANVAAETRTVIHGLYPNRFSPRMGEPSGTDLHALPAKTIVHRGHSGVVLAFDAVGLLEIASRAGCAVELVPQVGDFLATGEDAFRLYGPSADAVNESSLSACVALGSERILDQDPAFGFRILVDIAIKALSPAINDPTTGVLAVDQIHHLLHLLSQRQFEPGVVRNSAGEVRLAYRTPCWEDFVTLAVTEIRLCSAGNPQVTRRLQAMFEQLIQVVPAERSAALRSEIALLGRTIDSGFSDPEDRIIAGAGDLQGFGSRQSLHNPERVNHGLSV